MKKNKNTGRVNGDAHQPGHIRQGEGDQGQAMVRKSNISKSLHTSMERLQILSPSNNTNAYRRNSHLYSNIVGGSKDLQANEENDAKHCNGSETAVPGKAARQLYKRKAAEGNVIESKSLHTSLPTDVSRKNAGTNWHNTVGKHQVVNEENSVSQCNDNGGAPLSKSARKRHKRKAADGQSDGAKSLHPLANASRKNAGSNWDAHQSSKSATPNVEATVTPLPKDHVANEVDDVVQCDDSTVAEPSKAARLRQRRKAAKVNKYVAMDCEMVGVGFNGQDDMLARVSIVNKNGIVLLDKFVKPTEKVIDYRTSISGIRPRDIENADEFNVVQDEVVQLLQGKVLIGHGLRKDLAVLHIKHPYMYIRDTAKYKPLCRLVANGHTPSLKRLTLAILGQEIQTGEHNSVEDARAVMSIYNRLSRDWELYLQERRHHRGHSHHK